MQLFLFITVVIMIVFGSIHFQNQDLTITMKFITWTFEQKPIALILAIPLAIGILAGSFICVPPWLKKTSLARHQKKRIHELEAELTELTGPADSEEVEEEIEVIKEGLKEEV